MIGICNFWFSDDTWYTIVKNDFITFFQKKTMTKVDEIDGPVIGVAWGGKMESTYAHPF